MDGDTGYRVGDLVSEPHLSSAVDILEFDSANPGILSASVSSRSDALSPIDVPLNEYVLPFQPLSYRDFMLYEKHCIDAARGFVRKYFPRLMPAIII